MDILCKPVVKYRAIFICTDGVIGVRIGSEFVEESNFHISDVVMKVKICGSEAGWVVKIAEVTEDQDAQ